MAGVASEHAAITFVGRVACGVQGSGLRVQGSGFRVQGLGLRIRGSGLRVEGAGVVVCGLGLGFKESGVWV